MIWTAWINNKHHATGSGYGFKVDASDRDRHFKRTWKTVSIQLPTAAGIVTAEANIDKPSFWGPKCRELIRKEIGAWMLERGYAPWPDGELPKFEVECISDRTFRVRDVAKHGQ